MLFIISSTRISMSLESLNLVGLLLSVYNDFMDPKKL